MRPICFLLILLFLSCKNRTSPVGKTSFVDTTKTDLIHKTNNSKYYTSKDTLQFVTELEDTFRYTKKDFNELVDRHPEFFDEYPQDPDAAYYCNANKEEFNSEVGQDAYFEVYAYFLKQRNGTKVYTEQRKKLIDIYTSINFLFLHFQHGGTYFAHQIPRVFGYAEYSVYLYKLNEKDFTKTYNIGKQKSLYIQSLRQLIADENDIDTETLEQDKVERSKELQAMVDKIEKAITNNFYLRRAQEFQYGHYQYY